MKDFRNTPDKNLRETLKNIREINSDSSCRPAAGFRRCKKCNRVLALNNWNWYQNKKSPDGYAYTCRECMLAYQKKKG